MVIRDLLQKHPPKLYDITRKPERRLRYSKFFVLILLVNISFLTLKLGMLTEIETVL